MPWAVLVAVLADVDAEVARDCVGQLVGPFVVGVAIADRAVPQLVVGRTQRRHRRAASKGDQGQNGGRVGGGNKGCVAFAGAAAIGATICIWNSGTITFGITEVVAPPDVEVPEPASTLLIGAGLAIMGYASRRRRQGAKAAV